jgi:hypothetical protein
MQPLKPDKSVSGNGRVLINSILPEEVIIAALI